LFLSIFLCTRARHKRDFWLSRQLTLARVGGKALRVAFLFL
jgi:hypothetical protein